MKKRHLTYFPPVPHLNQFESILNQFKWISSGINLFNVVMQKCYQSDVGRLQDYFLDLWGGLPALRVRLRDHQCGCRSENRFKKGIPKFDKK